MMDIAQDTTFSHTGAWRKDTSGDGSVTISSGIASCEGAADDRAILAYYVPVLPGQRVEFEVYGLLVSGTAVVAIDSTTATAVSVVGVDTVDVDATDWKRYHVSYTVPQKSTAPVLVRVACGVPSAPAGEAKFHSPVVRTTGGYGQPVVIATGLIKVASGTASMDSGFPSYGMSVERTDTNTVTVTLTQAVPSSPGVRPRVFVSGTVDNEEIPVSGMVTAGATPTLTVKWSSGSAFADISTGTWYAFIRVEI